MKLDRASLWAYTAMVLVLALFLASCVTGPNYQRPSLNAPAQFKSAADVEKVPSALNREWWRLFNEPELDALIQEALQANLDLKAATARVAQSRASASTVKGTFLPVVTLDPSVARSRTPAATSSPTQIPFDLSYEIDIWGRVQRSYEAAQAQTLASVYALEVVRQTLLADLARNYFSLRSFDTQHEILARNLVVYQEQVDLTQNQYKAGLINETSLLQANVQLESTRAQAADVLRQRADLEHAIAILLGRAPADFSLGVRPLDAVPLSIPAGLPSDLLRQRPDVAEAEQNLVAASAQIGVAKADFFPTIRLTGAAGFQSSDTQNILDWSNRVWSLGPSVSLPLFKGGQLRANLQKAKAKYDELDAVYRKTVITAFGEVEDSLTDLHLRADAAGAQAKAVAAAREYLRLTQLEYQTGVVDYLHVVNAEQTLLNNELSQAQTLNQRMASSLLLVKALGGGWEAQPAVPAETTHSASAAAPGQAQ